MGMMSPGSIAIIPGAEEVRRNRDIYYPFRQDSDFFYLTGFCEPQAALVLVPGRAQGQEILFCAERDERKERYDGEMLGPERAVQNLGVDDAFPIGDIDDILSGLLEGKERVFMTLGEYPRLDARVLGLVAGIRAREAGGARPPGEFTDLKHMLHELRLVKSRKEIALMRRAAEITAAGHRRAMLTCQPGMTEGQLEAELQYAFMREGARCAAYPTIVGGGENACVLHYVDNRDELRGGDLVLIDAGCEYQHYAADITRTFPVNGTFSAAQRQVYDWVLKANLAAIDTCRAGQTFNEPHDAALRVLVEGLIELGVLQGEVQTLIEQERYLPFVPHKTSHWLGIDVHDVGDYQFDESWRSFVPGMVLTVEPGLYFPPSLQKEVPVALRGIGVRIEDDVLITDTHPEVLSADVPKGPDEIERLMAGSGDV